MKKYIVMADVCCDLSEELRTRFDIKYIKGHMTLPDGSSAETTCDWNTMDSKQFYASLKNKKNVYTTSPANIDEFANAFEGYIKEGYDVLCLTISSALSGTYNFALKAREQVLTSYPDAKVYVVDSMRFSNGLGLLTIHASMLREQGKTIEETVAWIEENKNRFHQTGWLDDLSFVAQKGRISNSKAFFGTLIGIKPIGEFDYNGLTTVLGNAKGEKNAYNVILSYVENMIENPEEQIILIAQTDRLKQAQAYKAMIEERFHPKEVIITDVYAADGINVGPGLMAAYYIGKPISKGLVEERALIEKLLSK
ncbi:MAG: DegV family protein [Candidatus Coproplasma sp.]